MANFCDLPKPVREKIYRLHLVKDDPVGFTDHQRHTIDDPADRRAPWAWGIKLLPAICFISDKFEQETAPIYYGENRFAFGRTRSGSTSSLQSFTAHTWPRHIRLVRKLIYQWPSPQRGYYTNEEGAGYAMPELARFSGLQELYLRVDENAMIRHMLRSRRTLQDTPPRPFTLQDGYAILRHPGMSHLLKMSNIPHVELLKKISSVGREEGGPVAGGFLQTVIVPKLKAPKKKAVRKMKTTFDFLGLPPELRNRIYGLVLKLDGPVHPSTEAPSSVSKNSKAARNGDLPGSALNILATNSQIHEEAYGMFYAANDFEFYYPIQLQAFAVYVGPSRLRQVRSLTIHYHNVKCGGIDLAEMSFQTLKQSFSLSRLHVLFVEGGLKRRLSGSRWGGEPYYISRANPLGLPGIKKLFEMRGISDIVIRDTEFEDDLIKIKKDQRYPERFADHSRECIFLKLETILKHVNDTLAAAQEGMHNREILDNPRWHVEDQFPPAKVKAPKVVKAKEPPAGENATANKVVADTEVEVIGEVGTRTTRSMTRESTSKRRLSGDIRSWLRPRTQAAPQAVGSEDLPEDEEDEEGSGAADDTSMDVADAVEDDEEVIVFKHVAPATKAAAIGGLDGADELDGDIKDEDEDVEESYTDREPSVEL